MKLKSLSAIALVCTLSVSIFAKDAVKSDAVVLKADYSGAHKWLYSIQYTSQGNFRQKSSNTAKTTEIKCLFSGEKTPAKKLAVHVDSVAIKSDIYSQDLQKEIKDKLVKANYSLSLANGFPSIDTSMEIPASSYLEWDLYRQLSKLLPLLPPKPVKPGFNWERMNVFPMKTARGTESCEVYRNYTLDKVSSDTAMISWKFRYAGSKKAADSTADVNEIPVFGTGNGAAMLNIKTGCIISAEMNFTTPVAVVGDVSIVWHENAVITLVGIK